MSYAHDIIVIFREKSNDRKTTVILSVMKKRRKERGDYNELELLKKRGIMYRMPN